MKRYSIVMLAGILGILTGLSACTNQDPPMAPIDTDSEYIFIYNGASSYQYWRYSVPTQVVDTFTLSVYPATFLAVTPDEKTLLVPQFDQLSVVSCDSLVVLEHVPYGARRGVAVSGDGSLVAVHDRYVTRLVRSTDWSVVRLDSIISGRGTFSSDGQSYYCTGARSGEPQAVQIIPTDPGQPVASRELAGLTPDRILLSPDNARWYLYDHAAATLGVVAIYDPGQDSVLATFELPSAFGDIVLSPDGDRLYASAPGSGSWHPPVPGSDKIYEFDTGSRTLTREIDLTALPTDSSGIGPTDIGSIALCNNGRRLVGSSSWNASYLLDLDLHSLTATQLFDFGRTGALYYMSD